MFSRFTGGADASSYAAQTAGMATPYTTAKSKRVRSAMGSRTSEAFPGYPGKWDASSGEGTGLAAYHGRRKAAGGSGGGDTNITVITPPAEIAPPKKERKPRNKKKDNPFGSLGYDEFGDLALSNPSGIGLLDSVENTVSSVPVVGSVIAPIITPAALGAAAAAVHNLRVPRLQGYLP